MSAGLILPLQKDLAFSLSLALMGIGKGFNKGDFNKLWHPVSSVPLNQTVLNPCSAQKSYTQKDLWGLFSSTVSPAHSRALCLSLYGLSPTWNPSKFNVLWSFQMDGSLLSWRIATNHWTGRRAPEWGLPRQVSQVLRSENGIREEDLWCGADAL